MSIKSNQENVLISLIYDFQNNLYNIDKIRDIYYKTIIYSGKIFGWVEKNYYSKYLSSEDWITFKYLSENGSETEFQNFKKRLSKEYFNGTIQPKIHQQPDWFITIHHISEIEKDIPTNLSNWKYNTKKFWKHHLPDNLVYTDYMFHYFIHIMIMVLKKQKGTNLYDEVNVNNKKENKWKNLKLYINNNYNDNTLIWLNNLCKKVKNM